MNRLYCEKGIPRIPCTYVWISYFYQLLHSLVCFMLHYLMFIALC